MPVLPLIDLLILLGWTTLAAGGLLKAIYLATSYRPTLLSLTPLDLFFVAMAFLGLALTLAARTWVRFNEPHLLAQRRNGRAADRFVQEGLDAAPMRPQPAPAVSAAHASQADPAPDAPTPTAGHWQRVR